jgi:hypothetical protein
VQQPYGNVNCRSNSRILIAQIGRGTDVFVNISSTCSDCYVGVECGLAGRQCRAHLAIVGTSCCMPWPCARPSSTNMRRSPSASWKPVMTSRGVSVGPSCSADNWYVDRPYVPCMSSSSCRGGSSSSRCMRQFFCYYKLPQAKRLGMAATTVL